MINNIFLCSNTWPSVVIHCVINVIVDAAAAADDDDDYDDAGCRLLRRWH